jgi:hypothetical protein
MKWEYRTVIYYAKAHEPETREYLRTLWPGWEPPRSAPQALIPKLNEIGSRGWELVSLQPVFIDDDANVLVHGGPNPPSPVDDAITGMIKAKARIPIPSSGPGHEPTRYTNAYLCAFKRQVPDNES